MKAKIKRVQPCDFDYSTLSDDDLQIYIEGLVGTLISTISNQCLLSPFTVYVCMSNYLRNFDSDNYLRSTRQAREYIQNLIKG